MSQFKKTKALNTSIIHVTGIKGNEAEGWALGELQRKIRKRAGAPIYVAYRERIEHTIQFLGRKRTVCGIMCSAGEEKLAADSVKRNLIRRLYYLLPRRVSRAS